MTGRAAGRSSGPRRFERFRHGYQGALDWTLDHRKLVGAAFAVLFVGSLGLYPLIGQNFFPTVDAGQLRLHVRVPTGTRVEETEVRFRQVEQVVARAVAVAAGSHFTGA